MRRTRVACILGPTGTGKTDAALALAERFGGAIVNFDSRQVYEGLGAVTAQPTPAEQARCPHYLYGFLHPCESISAGDFLGMAEVALDEVAAGGLLPILVGGTGMYLDSLLGGLAPIPEIPAEIRHAVQAECDRLGPGVLHARLARIDPEYAAKIHANDRQRITRALEVHVATERTFSSWHAVRPDTRSRRLEALRIGLRLDLDKLTPALGRRIALMLEAGALEEVRGAYERCPRESAPAFTGIGCRELLDVILGRASLEDAKAGWLARTRAYAKRQMTWFKRDASIHWFNPGEHRAIADLTKAWLAQEGGDE